MVFGARIRLHYYSKTDSLYVKLSDRTSTESEEVAAGIVVDFDSDGHIVGLDIDHASKLLDLSTLETESIPLKP